VIHPPVDVDFFTPGPPPSGPYFLVVSALGPYKRIDIAIRAAEHLGVPLKIVGSGPDLPRLRAMSGPSVEFTGSIDRDALRDAYRHAAAFVLPAEEDFGIAPVESLACGRPVVALNRGGAIDTIEHGVTGLLVDEATPEAFAAAMHDAARRPFDAALLARRAARFGVARFEQAFRQVVSDTLTAAAC
jgi:glycosyltransferase involved in cell wall biosynthesis